MPNVQLDAGAFGAKLPTASDANGQFTLKLGESPVYFLIAQKEGYYARTFEINGNNIQPSYTIALMRKTGSSTVTATLMKNHIGNIGFWRCAATADETKLLLVNGMENWEDESIKTQARLYLLDTGTGNILWTHNMGWESWSADITEDGKYVAFGTKLEGFQTGPAGFVNYIRLLNGTDGTTIWQKYITSQNFPNSTEGEFYTRAIKFTHNGECLLVPVHGAYAYLLNSEDGSIRWSVWVGSEVREVIFSKDDQYVYIPSSSGFLYKFRVVDGSLVWRQWIGCWPYVNGFDISSNEAYLFHLRICQSNQNIRRHCKVYYGSAQWFCYMPFLPRRH
ncbi:MAG: PQQ-like beta-propeller repeat protein [Candidatus Bathyarchaeota archaeon]|nr:PQQ-like beta-propeller repeat protein [Candidatus Bathyarchaeota archaeon]